MTLNQHPRELSRARADLMQRAKINTASDSDKPAEDASGMVGGSVEGSRRAAVREGVGADRKKLGQVKKRPLNSIKARVTMYTGNNLRRLRCCEHRSRPERITWELESCEMREMEYVFLSQKRAGH
jgi:hypothetical protein